jgi:hypothetical protein
MRLSDHNEQRFKTAAEELSRTVSGLRALGEVSQAVNSTLDLARTTKQLLLSTTGHGSRG